MFRTLHHLVLHFAGLFPHVPACHIAIWASFLGSSVSRLVSLLEHALMLASESSDERTSERSQGVFHPSQVPSLSKIKGGKRGSSSPRRPLTATASVRSCGSNTSADNRIDLPAASARTASQQTHRTVDDSSSDNESDDSETSQFEATWDPPAPSIASLQPAALWATMWPWAALISVSSGLLVLQSITGQASLWFGIGHTVLALAVAAWMQVCAAIREQALLVALGEEVSDVVTSDDGGVTMCLSHDHRVCYVQAKVHGRIICATIEKEEARLRASDPMHFIRDDLKDWDVAETGHIVVDTTGVILYANKALCKRLGHSQGKLLGENVRILMPQPYSKQHDFFMKKYLDTGLRNVIGLSRAVPVLKADGTQGLVKLGVDEVEDPFGTQGRLFVGVCDRAALVVVSDNPVWGGPWRRTALAGH